MGYTRGQMKRLARENMKSAVPSAIWMTLLLTVINWGVMQLVDLGTGGAYSMLQMGLLYNPGLILALSLLQFLIGLLLGVLNYGYHCYCLGAGRNQSTGYGILFCGFRDGRALSLTLQMVIFIFLWSLLFVIPGIIAAYRYRMAYYILADHPNMRASEALKASKEMMYGRKWSLFVLDLSFLGWFLLQAALGVVFLMLGLPLVASVAMAAFGLWLTPYHSITCVHFYRSARGELF